MVDNVHLETRTEPVKGWKPSLTTLNPALPHAKAVAVVAEFSGLKGDAKSGRRRMLASCGAIYPCSRGTDRYDLLDGMPMTGYGRIGIYLTKYYDIFRLWPLKSRSRLRNDTGIHRAVRSRDVLAVIKPSAFHFNTLQLTFTFSTSIWLLNYQIGLQSRLIKSTNVIKVSIE